MPAEIEPVAWKVCCDFHSKPLDIKIHLENWAALYGRDKNDEEIVAPFGYKLLPFRARVPAGKHAVFDARLKVWIYKDCASTITPIFTNPQGLYIRAYAVPLENPANERA